MWPSVKMGLTLLLYVFLVIIGQHPNLQLHGFATKVKLTSNFYCNFNNLRSELFMILLQLAQSSSLEECSVVAVRHRLVC